MSLTKIFETDKVTPVNNPMVIVWSSSESSEDNFTYQITIKNGTTNETLSTINVWSDPSNSNYCIYNMNMILSNYIDFDKTWNVTGFTINSNNSYLYDYTITEYILDTSGATSTIYNLYAIQAAFNYDETFNYEDYICSGSVTPGLFLSKWSGNRTYGLTDYGSINAFNTNWVSSTSPFNKMVINVTTNAGVTSKYYITNSNVGNNIITLPIGPKNLNDAVSGGIVYLETLEDLLMTTDIIKSDTNYYRIYLTNDDDLPLSETIKIVVDKECSRYDGTEFMWMGKLSTNETYTFKFGNVKEYKIEREETKNNHYSLIGDEWTYSIGDRGRKTTFIKTTERHTAISGWLNDEISSNLMELYNSKEVYIIKNDNIYPVIVVTNKIEEKTIQNNRLFNHIIEYEMAYLINNNL